MADDHESDSERAQWKLAWSHEAEFAVLASMLQQPRCIAEVGLLLSSEDFLRPVHGMLYDAMVEIHEAGPLDPVKLSTWFVSRGLARQYNVTSLIFELKADTGVIPGGVGHHALRVRELSRVRRFRQMFERGLQVIEETERGYWEVKNGPQDELDIDRLQSAVASVLLEGEVLVDEKLTETEIEGLSTYAEFMSQPESPHAWLVEEFLETEDVWMILGSEGGGKSYLSRQMVQTLSAGIHPFEWDEGHMIEPVCSLLVDLENAPSMVRRQSRGTWIQAQTFGDLDRLNANAHIWTKRDGLNLRQKHDQMLFQAVIERVRPRFVALGSLYNSFVKGRDDWETAAEDVKTFFMRMKARYGFTLWLEHHMPKGDGANRPQTPYGSSVWQRWVTHGRTIVQEAEGLWSLEPFRTDRDPRKVPAGMTRGGLFPWTPIWGRDDLAARIEIQQEVEHLRGQRGRRPQPPRQQEF